MQELLGVVPSCAYHTGESRLSHRSQLALAQLVGNHCQAEQQLRSLIPTMRTAATCAGAARTMQHTPNLWQLSCPPL